MPFCDYCDTEQAGVPNGLGALYCFTCGLTISELYFVEEQALNEAAKAASYKDMAEAKDKKREAQKLARKQKRQQRASDAKDAVPARTAAEASVGTLNKKFKTGSEDDKLIFQALDSLDNGTSQVQQEGSGIPIEEVVRDCDAHEVSHDSDIELCDQGDSVDPSMKPTIPILQKSRHQKKKGSRSSARSCPKKKDTNFVWS